MANPEIRYYGVTFIPVTGVEPRHLQSLEHKYLSQNNWIDFFDSRKESFWYYHKVEIESPRIRGFSLFAANEFLYYAGKQDTLIRMDGDERVVLSYEPSTSYYSGGINYAISAFADMKLMLTNQMLNRNHTSLEPSPRQQYMRRFYATEKPMLELLVLWVL